MPESSSFTSRPGADRCPGVLRLAEAADGMLARVRLPGGLVTGEQLRVLARLADDLGDGRAELTSRGNLQLRGLAANAASPLTSGLFQAGLLPSLSHDRVRNVLASPLAGLDRGPGLTRLVRALDFALCARPRLAKLSGRFLFALDDGRGDVAGLGADVVATVQADGAVVNGLSVRPSPGYRAVSAQGPDAFGAGTAAGVSDDVRDAVVAAMLAFAEAFLDLRKELEMTAWRIADLPAGADRVRAAAAARLGLAAIPEREQPDVAVTGSSRLPNRGFRVNAETAPRRGPGAAGYDPSAGPPPRPVGLVARGGAGDRAESLVLLAPLGRLTAAQVSWIADRVAGRAAARITPWRSVVLPDLDDAAGALREAAGLGFGTDEASPWLRVTACAGRPGCASALADVQSDAAAFAGRWPERIVHVSGCGRHCGRPAATEIDVTATSEGYQIAGV